MLSILHVACCFNLHANGVCGKSKGHSRKFAEINYNSIGTSAAMFHSATTELTCHLRVFFFFFFKQIVALGFNSHYGVTIISVMYDLICLLRS